MPSISAPSMPQIGEDPYGPWSSNQGNTSATESKTEKTINSTVAGQALSAETISGLGGLEALSGLSESSDLSSYMSAISGLTGLTGSNSDLASTIHNLTNTNNKDATNTMLVQILEELKKISEKENSKGSLEKTEITTTTSLDKSEFYSPTEIQGSKLLRFKAKNTDLLGTCRTVYFSEPEANGIFLLTGDRVFYVGSKLRNETFYFLFKPQKNENGQFIYSVEAEVVQDQETTGSNLFELTKNLPLTATRTGNLVTLRYSADEWNLDILLDLQETR